MTTVDRIAIFTGPQPFESAIETIEYLIHSNPDAWFLIVAGGVKASTRARLRAKWRRFAKAPASTLIESILAVRARLVGRGAAVRTGNPSLPSLEQLQSARVQGLRFERIHEAAALEAVRAFSPDLGVCVGAPILKERLFAIPRLGTINLHKSLLPEYRGMPPGFWELFDGASESGVTVHWVDRGLDTGRIVIQQSLLIPDRSTIKGLQTELDVIGKELLATAIERIRDEETAGEMQEGCSTTLRTTPPFLVAKRLRAQLAGRRRPVQSIWRRLAKRVVLTGFVYLAAPTRNAWQSLRGESRVVILLYHRVNDRFLDTVTVGVEQFDRQLSSLGRHYPVLSLEAFLDGRGKPRRRRQVVVTFDDGYADNYLAAMLLRRRGLPATFFVNTRIVDTDKPFPHDMKRLGYRVAALTWNQMREMSSWGFSFGNHTSSHVDLGTADLAAAEAAICEAAVDLERELGAAAPGSMLAYPYGRRDNMSEAVRSQLSRFGVKWCLSAYGGSNPPDFESLDIRRQGIDVHVDDLMFRAIVEGWRVRT